LTKIDFYILSTSGSQAKETMACKLIGKVYNLKHRVYVHTASQEDAKQIDERLWTYRQDSFLPHEIYKPGQQPNAPIIIGYQNDPPPSGDDEVLVNLSSTVPEFFSQFERLTEFVEADDTARNEARQRFKFYKDRGYELTTHDLKA